MARPTVTSMVLEVRGSREAERLLRASNERTGRGVSELLADGETP